MTTAASEGHGGGEGRRIAAIVLPRLLVELALQQRPHDERSKAKSPLAILIEAPADGARGPRSEKRESALRIAAVNEAARQAGIHVGQTLAEAAAFSARLTALSLDEARVREALYAVADLAFSFGPTVEVCGAALDTVWVDVTGSAHLFGGEEALRIEIEDRLRSVGWTADVAIADGPQIAQALARHPGVSVSIAPKSGGAAAMAPLPIKTLLDDEDLLTLFVRLGVFTVQDFLELPAREISARLGARAGRVLSLARGDDSRPLEPYCPPDVLVEEVSFEDGVELTEPILFVLRGVTSRLAARLLGRAQATNHVELVLQYDARIHRLREEGKGGEPFLRMAIDLPAPLSSEANLFRTVKAKISDLALSAPVVSVTLILSRIADAPRVQLDLSRDVSVSPDALPALAAELAADIGEHNVGVLGAPDSHRPEAESVLRLFSESETRAPAAKHGTPSAIPVSASPTRLFPLPIPIGTIDQGATVFVGHDAFEVAASRFHRRLRGVEWWTEEPVSRDYFNVALVARGNGGIGKWASTLAWVFIDRTTGETFLHGLWE